MNKSILVMVFAFFIAIFSVPANALNQPISGAKDRAKHDAIVAGKGLGSAALDVLPPGKAVKAAGVVGVIFLKGKKVARGRQVLLDASVIPKLRSDPTLGGRLRPGDIPVTSFVTPSELRNAVGRSLKGVPSALDDVPVLRTNPSLDLRINIRDKLPAGRGRFGDGIIGAQAIEGRLPLITDDVALANVIRSIGGTVR